jgi:hypothetical protein
VNDKCSGQGRMVYKGGAVYEGQWRKGKWSGVGSLVYSPDHIFEGKFKDGERMDGHGEETRAIDDFIRFVNIAIYCPEVFLSLPIVLQGKLKTVEGDYEGEFVKGRKEGKGCFVSAFGDIYGEYAWLSGTSI